MKPVCDCEVYEVCEKCNPEKYKQILKDIEDSNKRRIDNSNMNEEFYPGKIIEEKERHGSVTFYNLLDEMSETHDKKSHDYASNSNPYGNYHFAGQIACMFSHSPEDAGFAGRLAEKIYRLANLESSGKNPLNESIADTERDIAVITALWMADRRDRRTISKREQVNLHLVAEPGIELPESLK